jgi:predicted dienelactone hydrolase
VPVVTTTTAVTTTLPRPLPPFPVTTTTLPFVDPTRPTVSRGVRIAATRSLTTDVWLPAIGGRWPLVVFAPGFRVGPDSYTQLHTTWAAAGYVVAAPEFPLADPAVAGSALDEGDLDNEPADVNFVIASLTDPASPLASQIDPTRIAVTGHSDGAEAALAVAQQGHPAIVAAIAMSGQPVIPHQAPNPPLLVIQGDADTINPPARSRAVYDQAANPRFLLTLAGAGHLPPFAGGSRWTPVVDAVTVDFLNLYLAATATGDAHLHADGNRSGLSALM